MREEELNSIQCGRIWFVIKVFIVVRMFQTLLTRLLEKDLGEGKHWISFERVCLLREGVFDSMKGIRINS